MFRLRHISFAAIAFVVTVCLTASSFSQIVWYVDDNAPNDPGPGDSAVSDPLENGTIGHPFDRVQEAITAAFVAHVVRVSSGTYNESISLLGKAITLESIAGPATTIIDAQGTGSVVSCIQSEGASTVIDGFTIRGGTGTSLAGYPIANGGRAGGGAFLWNASPTIRNCRFVDNTANAVGTGAGYGGGIGAFSGSSPTISNCTFKTNVAFGAINGYGGGMFVAGNSNAAITNCEFDGNNAYGHFNGFGGGLGIQESSSPQVMNCLFKNNMVSGNTLYGYGGGAFVGNGGTNSPQFSSCRFVGNHSEEYAAGMYVDATAPGVVIHDCVFNRNTAGVSGGAIRVDRPSVPAISATRFCESTPEHINGAWLDSGGNSFSAIECCPADVDDSGSVSVSDLLVVITYWGIFNPVMPRADINHDGFVNVSDLLVVVTNWGVCP